MFPQGFGIRITLKAVHFMLILTFPISSDIRGVPEQQNPETGLRKMKMLWIRPFMPIDIPFSQHTSHQKSHNLTIIPALCGDCAILAPFVSYHLALLIMETPHIQNRVCSYSHSNSFSKLVISHNYSTQ